MEDVNQKVRLQVFYEIKLRELYLETYPICVT